MNRLLTAYYNTPWAIVPDRLPMIQAVLHRWASGVKLSKEEIAAVVGDAPAAASARRGQRQPPGVGIISILGIMAQRTAGDVSSAGTATDRVRSEFAALMNNSAIEAILLDIDSPGGSVFGVQELAADIFAARGIKRVVAVANSQAASAAYWVATAAEEFVVTPGGAVGSIGVVAAHEDHSKRLEGEGIDVTLVSAGRYKVEGNPFQSLGEEARAAIQSDVDAYYSQFVTAVARHRGVSTSVVRSRFGQGRMVMAPDALRDGMVDRIGTFDQEYHNILSGSARTTTGTCLSIRHRKLVEAQLSAGPSVWPNQD